MKQLIILLALVLVVQLANATNVNKEKCKVKICTVDKHQDAETNLQCSDSQLESKMAESKSSNQLCPPNCDVEDCDLRLCELIPDCKPIDCVRD